MAWITKDKKGYKSYGNSGKKVHKHVAERMLGRPLRSGEVVHHKNRVKSDNRRSNLKVYPSQRAHYSAHKRNLARTGRW